MKLFLVATFLSVLGVLAGNLLAASSVALYEHLGRRIAKWPVLGSIAMVSIVFGWLCVNAWRLTT